MFLMTAPGGDLPEILFVIPGQARGSSMVFARRQAEALVKLGVPVSVFHLQSRTSPRILWREFRRFRRTLKRLQPGLVHAHFGTMTGLFTALACGRRPVAITYRGSDLNYVPSAHGPRAMLGRLFSQLAALRASGIVCVSEALRRQLWWRGRHNIVLPSGVDLDHFRPLPRSEARHTLGWPLDVPVVVFNAGHDARNKRLDLAEAAVAKLKTALPEARLEVLRGHVAPEQMPLVLNAADCLLMTSDAEGSPTIVQEALACNLPVVSVPVGDAPERLAGVAPSAICPRDPALLGQALETILRSGARSNGREFAIAFSSARIAQELARFYAAILAGRGVPVRTKWSTSLSSPPPPR